MKALRNTLAEHKMNRRGVTQLVMLAVGIAIAVVTVIIVAVLLATLQTSSAITVNSTAYNATANSLTMIGNFTAQLPLAGTILGLVLVLGIVGYLGYQGYQHFKGR